MLKEIDRDFYCSIGAFTGKDKCSVGSCNYYGCGIPSQSTKKCADNDCGFFHRKYPTLEQFKEEYGVEWIGAVYVLLIGEKMTQENWHSKPHFEQDVRWLITTLSDAYQKIMGKPAYDAVVCACTPFGKPTNDWRPE